MAWQDSAAASGLDAVNLATWGAHATVRSYERLSGWTDRGEQAAIESIAAEVRGAPLLDIGVGAGRTIGLLRPLAGDYTAIDYTAAMAERCRQRHPDVDVHHMDARDLSAFADGRFGWVVFSFNGLDSVPMDDRARVLREVHRVLRPGGLFVVSGHNRHGPNHDERPRLQLPLCWNPVKLGWRAVRSVGSLGRQWRNHSRLRGMAQQHADWAVANCAAHDFGIVIVYASLAEQERQLRAAGFAVERAYGNTAAEPLAAGADTRSVAWFHLVARRA